MVKRASRWLLGIGLLSGCNVAASSESTGGLGAEFSPAGAGSGCPRAIVVVGSDYTSSNVSVISPRGVSLSSSLISSASAAPGLTTALSGDVVLPTSVPTSGSLVLLDRWPNSVLTWVDPVTADVQRQLAVGTGFASNPHDYLELGRNKAYVTRYETNPKPGAQANDAGGDVLIIDPSAPAILGRVDMALADDGVILPRPSRLVRVGEQVWVTLERATEHFEQAGDARIVGLNPVDDAVAWTLDLVGATGCSGLAVSPSGKVVALACASLLGQADSVATSAVVLLDATAQPPLELKRIPMVALGAPVGSALSFYSETRLLGVALGDAMAGRNDLAYTLDTETQVATTLVQAAAPFTFGDLRCAPGCTNECVLADASARELQVWGVEGTQLIARLPFVPDTAISLPPRALGAL